MYSPRSDQFGSAMMLPPGYVKPAATVLPGAGAGQSAPRQCLHDARRSGGDPRDGSDIDGVRPAVLRQVKQGIGADQRQITPAGAVDVAGLAARHEFRWRQLMLL